jgi:hypothetical protein
MLQRVLIVTLLFCSFLSTAYAVESISPKEAIISVYPNQVPTHVKFESIKPSDLTFCEKCGATYYPKSKKIMVIDSQKYVLTYVFYWGEMAQAQSFWMAFTNVETGASAQINFSSKTAGSLADSVNFVFSGNNYEGKVLSWY